MIRMILGIYWAVMVDPVLLLLYLFLNHSLKFLSTFTVYKICSCILFWMKASFLASQIFLFSNFVKVRTENLGSVIKSRTAQFITFSAKELLSVPIHVRATKFRSGSELGTRTCTSSGFLFLNNFFQLPKLPTTTSYAWSQ